MVGALATFRFGLESARLASAMRQVDEQLRAARS